MICYTLHLVVFDEQNILKKCSKPFIWNTDYFYDVILNISETAFVLYKVFLHKCTICTYNLVLVRLSIFLV